MSETIKFILNDKLREVSGLPPTTTVLQYLRLQERLTGTKEGCAEGDCGACTIIVGELTGKGMRYQAVNACIMFLPALDGRHLITVEHLKENPVQKSIVEHHGSQCGFCTPGFVMSLTALAHNNPQASDKDIHDAIAGNLCRCTGYRPILDAARAVRGVSLMSNTKTLQGLQRSKMFSYEADGQKFFSPRTVGDIAQVLGKYPESVLLAGGTDVGLWVTKQHRQLDSIIYTGNVDALRRIEKTATGLEIGAAVSYTQAFKSLAAVDESLEELLRRLGSVQVRNLGTIGGNIANGSPIGDGMPPLIALRAQLMLRSGAGARSMPLENYFIEYRKQDRQPEEFVEKILVPHKPENVLFKTYKVSKRFDQDISAVCGAFALTVAGEDITDARIVFGGMAGTPRRGLKTEKFLQGKKWSEGVVRQAMTVLGDDFIPLSDMRASAEYRRVVAGNLLYRFFLETTEPEAATRVYSYGRK